MKLIVLLVLLVCVGCSGSKEKEILQRLDALEKLAVTQGTEIRAGNELSRDNRDRLLMMHTDIDAIKKKLLP